MLKSTENKITACAVIFAQKKGCSAQEIADILEMPVSIVYRFRKETEWDKTLDVQGFEGDRNFERKPSRDIQRDTGELVAQARAIYIKARLDGSKHKKAVTAVVNELELKRRRVNEWAARYQWEAAL